MVMRLLVVAVVLVLFSTLPAESKNILRTVLTNFDAQTDEIYLLDLLTNEGPTTKWVLHETPVCGELYAVTPELESNGANPCPDGVCLQAPLEAGQNLSSIVTEAEPYLVYLFPSKSISATCQFGYVDELLLEEYLIPENITLRITLAENVNNAPIAFGQTVTLNGEGSVDIELQSSIDIDSNPEYEVIVTSLPSNIGNLTRVPGGEVVEVGVAFPESTVRYTSPSGVFTPEGDPLGKFSFLVVGDSELRSGIVDVNLFVKYLGEDPIVEELEVFFLVQFDNVFTPVEVITDGPYPTEFILESLPDLAECEVYQASEGKRVGNRITTTPTRINDALIFYFVDAESSAGTFSYRAIDADDNSSPVTTMAYQAKTGSQGYPGLRRCIVNVAEQSSTVINLENDQCVIATAEGMDALSYFVLNPPEDGELFQWEDNTPGERIFASETNIPVSGELLFVNSVTGISPNYAEIVYTATETNDVFGNPVSAALVINVVSNTPPFIQQESVEATTLEDIPIVIELKGLDLERTLLSSTINTLPPRGVLHQFDQTQPDDDFKGNPIVANANDIFTPTAVTDPQNRVVFTPTLNEAGTPYTTFTYFVSDGIDESNLGIGSISVTPVPDDPISSSSFYTVEEVSKTIIQLEAFDPEGPDNEILQYEILSVPLSTLGDQFSGRLFQTDQFENYDPNEPILAASEDFPVVVEDSLGRLVYVAADVPVQFQNNGSQFFLQVDFQFQAFVPPNNGMERQESEISTVTIDVLGVNNPPFSQAQSVTTVEDTPVSITLEGSDNDPEDQDNLIVFITEVPRFGQLSQWVDLEQTQQFEIIQTNGISVSDSQMRVIYIPNLNQVGDPLDSFSFTYFDGRETSFSSEVTISVLCSNDAPGLGNPPENSKAEGGTDIVIYLGGEDVDANDPLGYCFGDMGTFRAVIAFIPNVNRSDFSELFQYIDPNDQGLTDPDRQDEIEFDPVTGLETYSDGSIPVKKMRGDPITQNETDVTDPLRRVILSAVFFNRDPDANSSVSQFSYYFRDAFSSSVVTDLNVEVRVLIGQDPDGYGETWKDIVAYLLAILVSALVLLFICIMLSLMNRKPVIEENDDGWDIAVAGDSDEEFEQEFMVDDGHYEFIEKPKGPLEELLLQENMRVVTTLCDIVEVTEFDEVAAALVAVFEFHNQTLELIKKLITKEIHDASSAGTLFRSNSMASKVMTAYSKKVGQDYLETTLITPISTILEKDFSFEVDPRKVGPGEDRKTNMKLLLKACENFLTWIMTSGNNAPAQFKNICYHLFKEVNEKFPQNRHSAVGGFLFLRFFCPAIISPDGHGIIPETSISVRSRRCFVLIAKAMQNLSNGLMFGQKEHFMMDVNVFIEKHKDDIIAFFEQMSREDMTGKGRPATIDPMELEEALNTIHRHLYLNVEEMCDILNQRQRHNTEGTIQSEIASKMTEGLTTFLHTQSHLDTPSSITRTHRTNRTHRGGTTMGGKTGRSEATQWDWGQDDQKTDDQDFTFEEGGGSDLEGSSLVDTDNIEPVPFGGVPADDDEITDFELSSAVPDSTESGIEEHTSLLSGFTDSSSASNRSRRDRRRLSRRASRRMSRRSQMTATATDMSMMSTYDQKSASKRAKRVSRSVRTMTGELADYVDFGGDGSGVELDEIDEDEAGYDDQENLSIQLLRVLDDLGAPPGL